MKLLLQLALSACLLLPLHAQEPAADQSSAALTTKAWKAMGAAKHADAIAACKECIKLYEKDALKMQKALKAPVEGTEDEVNAKWALNDVGTCYFIMGQALEKQKKMDDAKAAYESLGKNLAYAQCWDPNGWFWSPAKAAKERMAELKTDDDK